MVTIKYNADLDEFQVLLKDNPDATYFTDCPVDARLTALEMSTSNRCSMQVHRSARSLINRATERVPAYA